MTQTACKVRDDLMVAYLHAQGELSKRAADRIGYGQRSGAEIESAERAVAISRKALVDHCRAHGC